MPARGEEAAIQRRDDDDETLEPHAKENRRACGKEDAHAGAASLRPEELWHHDVAREHDPIEECVGTARPFDEIRESLAWIAAVPGDKELDDVGVAQQQ